MEVIRLAGYVAIEKMAIARKYLELAARKATGIDDGATVLTDGAVAALAEMYCREAGVRDLPRRWAKIPQARSGGGADTAGGGGGGGGAANK